MDDRERGVDFWLGDRGEGKVTDFDGRLRACRVLKRVRMEGGEATQVLVHVDPPIPLGSGTSANHVVLGSRWRGRDLEDLPQDIDELIAACTQLEESDRPKNAAELVSWIDKLIDKLESESSPEAPTAAAVGEDAH